MQGYKNSISKIYKDISQSMVWPARLEASFGPGTNAGVLRQPTK